MDHTIPPAIAATVAASARDSTFASSPRTGSSYLQQPLSFSRRRLSPRRSLSCGGTGLHPGSASRAIAKTIVVVLGPPGRRYATRPSGICFLAGARDSSINIVGAGCRKLKLYETAHLSERGGQTVALNRQASTSWEPRVPARGAANPQTAGPRALLDAATPDAPLRRARRARGETLFRHRTLERGGGLRELTRPTDRY